MTNTAATQSPRSTDALEVAMSAQSPFSPLEVPVSRSAALPAVAPAFRAVGGRWTAYDLYLGESGAEDARVDASQLVVGDVADLGFCSSAEILDVQVYAGVLGRPGGVRVRYSITGRAGWENATLRVGDKCPLLGGPRHQLRELAAELGWG